MQDSREDNIERYESQVDIREDNKDCDLPSQLSPNKERNTQHITNVINQLTKEISYLNQKRPPPNKFFPFYLNILSSMNNHTRLTPNSYSFLNNLQIYNNIIEDYILSANAPTKKYSTKIGVTSEDICRISKYRIDYRKLPKFGRISDNQLFAEDLTNLNNNMMLNRNLDGKLPLKRKVPSYSCIERQNKEALKMIEQRRQKYKNVPKAQKEKMDNNRLHKYWEDMSKHDIPKFPKIYQKAKNETEGFTKRLATLVQKEIKKKVNKVQRAQKECNLRARKLQKEMLVYWRKREKEIVDIQRKKDKIEIDKKKKEDELQEQIIQKKRMEYLLRQSDIYSLMMYKHLGAYMPQEENKQEKEDNKTNEIRPDDPNVKQEIISGKNVLVNKKTNKIIFQSIRVDIDENKAKEDVQMLIDKQRQKATEFDQNLNRIRKTLGGDEVEITKFNDNKNNDDVEMTNADKLKNENQLERLDKPMINNSSSQLIEVPKNFNGELKEYQLKGLRWLDNLFEQGINGILADEMGLGKTIQAIAFLAHLSESKNNWGPFLVIAPNATLYNWQQEFNRFCPSLKVLPYWGALKERKTLRKFFNSSQLYVKSSAFHVCITSYQLIVSDEKVFHKVNWNYMILDEAQAIKNIASQRWNVLLSFNCRNRLLLSGTPIQNSMSELWALLHFIMPNLFDSHEQFQEWFSKDIEAHSQDKGELNKEQLKRLHKILKPFMLRRVKKDVEHEIGPKVEYEIPCEMTEKQKILYNSIKEKLSNISDLFMSTDSKVKVTNLMNLVMQFRKVCNHPELFERNFGKIPFTFRDLSADYGCNNTFTLINGDVYIRTNTDSIITYEIPKMIYDLCYDSYKISKRIPRQFNLYQYDNVVYEKSNSVNSIFNFAPLLGVSLSDFLSFFSYNGLINHIALMHFFTQVYMKNKYYKDQKYSKKKNFSLLIASSLFPQEEDFSIPCKDALMPSLIINSILSLKANLNHKIISHKFYIPKALAFVPKIICSNTQLQINQEVETNSLFMNKILYGNDYKQFHSNLNLKLPNKNREILSLIDQDGIMTPLFYQNEGYTQIELPSFDRLISDCAKLKKLDELLKTMHKENHRVLIFCQMTHMIDILEEYMAKRKYSYFRMDGSTNIADRRDMINEFQTNPKIFAFLLSTRAGGLGVNLTGADTVIFYDNDWNPTMDAQATDRAHRIGQTKVVSVYRLITAGTIEERILKRAKQKQNVQTTVYSGGAFKADIFKQNDIVELLYSEEEMQKMEQEKRKILLELNNGIKNEEGTTINANGNTSTIVNTDNNAMKNKKKKKKDQPSKKKSTTTAKKKNNPSEDNSATQSNSGDTKQKNNSISRNIFAVRNNGLLSKGNQQVNAIKLDSSDDENNVIIDDGEHPIEIDEDDNNDNMDID